MTEGAQRPEIYIPEGKLLIVDDDEIHRLSMGWALEEEGVPESQIERAASIEEVEALLDGLDPGRADYVPLVMAIVDFNIGLGGNGAAVARLLHERLGPDFPVALRSTMDTEIPPETLNLFAIVLPKEPSYVGNAKQTLAFLAEHSYGQ